MKTTMQMITEMLNYGEILELHGGPRAYTAEIIEAKHGDTVEAAIHAIYKDWKRDPDHV